MDQFICLSSFVHKKVENRQREFHALPKNELLNMSKKWRGGPVGGLGLNWHFEASADIITKF